MPHRTPTTPAAAEPLDGAVRDGLRALFLDQGFVRVGFTSAEPVPDHVSAWVAAGSHAGLEWMARQPGQRADPQQLLPGARSVICVAASYPRAVDGSHVAAYACGEDYHRTLRAALDRAVAGMPGLLGRRPATRVCVDTAPLLERALAARAGLGWIGRNTMLLDEGYGPWLLLGEVLTDLVIAPDAPAIDRCGSCTACVDACPTGALDGEHRLDARRCLSYWSIEHRGVLPQAWAQALGRRAFGCDDCLEACPFPRGERPLPQPGPFVPRAELAALPAAELERRAGESFQRHFGNTPIERARKGGFLRNLAAIHRGRAGEAPRRGTRPPGARGPSDPATDAR